MLWVPATAVPARSRLICNGDGWAPTGKSKSTPAAASITLPSLVRTNAEPVGGDRGANRRSELASQMDPACPVVSSFRGGRLRGALWLLCVRVEQVKGHRMSSLRANLILIFAAVLALGPAMGA